MPSELRRSKDANWGILRSMAANFGHQAPLNHDFARPRVSERLSHFLHAPRYDEPELNGCLAL